MLPISLKRLAITAVLATGALVAAAAAAQTHIDSALAPATGTLLSTLDVQTMVLNASWPVKFVMLTLALASLVSWATLIVKLQELRVGDRSMEHAKTRLKMAPRLDRVGEIDHLPVLQLLEAAQAEMRHSEGLLRSGQQGGVQARLGLALQRIEEAHGRQLGRGLSILASVGSVSPFIGLFGTVWGIMHSFIDIAQTNTTNLAVVAPGIAEALLATAVGLAAAIPATLMYNALGRRIVSSRAGLADCVALVLCIASRDMDFLSHGHTAHSPATSATPAAPAIAATSDSRVALPRAAHLEA